MPPCITQNETAASRGEVNTRIHVNAHKQSPTARRATPSAQLQLLMRALILCVVFVAMTSTAHSYYEAYGSACGNCALGSSGECRRTSDSMCFAKKVNGKCPNNSHLCHDLCTNCNAGTSGPCKTNSGSGGCKAYQVR